MQSATTKAIHYFRPLCLEHSLELLAQKQLTIVAGATDLYPAKVAHNGWGDWRQQALLDISGLSELQGISDRNSHFRIGALTTWSHIAQAALPAYFTPLQQAAQCIGALQIQNRGTIGGNICNASPAADGVPVLLCLDAQVELSSQSGVRILRLDEFVLGYRKTARQENELVTAILIPKLAGRALGGFESWAREVPWLFLSLWWPWYWLLTNSNRLRMFVLPLVPAQKSPNACQRWKHC